MLTPLFGKPKQHRRASAGRSGIGRVAAAATGDVSAVRKSDSSLAGLHHLAEALRAVGRGAVGQAPRSRKREGKSAEEVDALEDFVVPLSRFVEIHREGCEPLRFRINCHKSGHITFTDSRECETGTGGTTGLWGTLPPMEAGLPRSLTPTAFKAELSRLVGIETAEQVIREITQDDFFSTKNDTCKTAFP